MRDITIKKEHIWILMSKKKKKSKLDLPPVTDVPSLVLQTFAEPPLPFPSVTIERKIIEQAVS
jgi:hypothetical protein